MTLAPKTGLGRAGLTSGLAGLGGGSLSASGGATVWTPDALFASGELGDWWDFRTADGLFEDVEQSTPTTDGAVVGSAVGRRGWSTLEQGSTASKPTWTGGEIRGVTGQADLDGSFTSIPAGTANSLYVVGRAVAGTSTTANRFMGRVWDVSTSTVRLQTLHRRGSTLETIQSSSTASTGADEGFNKVFSMVSDRSGGTGTGCIYNSFAAYNPAAVAGARQAASGLRLSCQAFTSNTSAGHGAVFINRRLTEAECNLLNNYYGV